MPPWRVHEEFAREMLEELGIEGSARAIEEIDRLVDEPLEFLGGLGEELEERATTVGERLLALIATSEALRPSSPFARHDWRAWALDPLPYLEALREIAELLYGEVGRLLADLHVVLDFLWCLESGPAGFEAWCERTRVDRRVVDFAKRKVIPCLRRHSASFLFHALAPQPAR